MKKNVGFIIPGLKNGGAERVLSTLSLNLNNNLNQYIFTWNGKEKDYDFNAEIVDINIKNSDNLIKNIFVLFKRVKEVKKYKKQLNIETAISHLEGANIVNILSRGREKVIITVHNFQSEERKGIYGVVFKTLIKLLYNKADKIVVVSELIKKDLIKSFNIKKEKIEVIYNPFDCKKIERLSKESLDKEYLELFENKVIINIGRLEKQKGQWNLINSFLKLKNDIKNIKLVILGVGELEQELKLKVSQLGIEDDVIFLGFQKNPFKFLAKADVFAMTSLYEGFPMSIIEAMICKTPVVSVDCKSGPREIFKYDICVEDEVKQNKILDFGILTPMFKSNIDIFEDDENISQQFAKALYYILENSEESELMTNNSFLRAKSFDIKNVISKWEKLI